MRQQYLALVLLAILAAGCGILSPPAATPVPFNRLSAQDVFNAFARAGLEMQNPQQDLVVSGRGAPTGLQDRYTFEIPGIAPAGGQIVVFASQDQLQAWQAYIDQLRSSSATRRDVVYTYFNANVMLQLSADLTNDQASGYQKAFLGIN